MEADKRRGLTDDETCPDAANSGARPHHSLRRSRRRVGACRRATRTTPRPPPREPRDGTSPPVDEEDGDDGPTGGHDGIDSLSLSTVRRALP